MSGCIGTHLANTSALWRLSLAEQTEFKRSGTDGKCIEAREFIIALPESFVDYPPDECNLICLGIVLSDFLGGKIDIPTLEYGQFFFLIFDKSQKQG